MRNGKTIRGGKMSSERDKMISELKKIVFLNLGIEDLKDLSPISEEFVWTK